MEQSVSIVIPTFNRANMLPRAIDSALNQTVPCEVIVVDHGSTDHTQDVASSYGDLITYIQRKHDFGPHFCWLDGVLHSSHDLIHLQYDDDWLEQTYIEACLDVMDEKTGFAFSVVRIVKDTDKTESELMFDKWLDASGTYPVKQLERRLLRSLISPGCCLFRREILIDGLYQGRLPLQENEYHGVGPDRFLAFLSALRYEKIGFVKEPLAVFFDHDGSITTDAGRDAEKLKAFRAAYAETVQFYKDLKIIRFIRTIRKIFR